MDDTTRTKIRLLGENIATFQRRAQTDPMNRAMYSRQIAACRARIRALESEA